MDSRFEEFCINNDPPPDKVVQEVLSLLVQPLRDLKDLDVEILNLENRLEELKAKRNDAQKWISRHQVILSPIRRLPGDVLGEIFEHCLPFHTNPILKETESPLLLTHVCKLWRGVALSEPRLWSRIHITFTAPQPLGPRYAGSISKNQVVLRRRLDALKKWLSHAGTRPLSISIHFVEAGTVESSLLPMELFTFLARLSPRFEDLELTMPLETFYRLESMMDVPQMTNLKSLRISLPRRTGTNIKPLLVLKAPRLRQVFTFRCDHRLWGVMDSSYTSVWGRLTNISCYMAWFSKHEIITLLEHTPNLVHLAVTVSDPSDAEGVPFPSHTGNISLPFLRTLFLEDVMSFSHRGNLYECIDAPGLKWVMFTPSTNTFDGDDFSNSWPIPIIPLLRRAKGLKKLSFNPLYIEAWDLRDLFLAVPSITHLFIGTESRAADGTIQRVKRPLVMWVRASPFKFQLLSSSDGTPLLPNLQSLEINSQMIQVDPEELLYFIKYRRSSSAGSGISVFKHIAVVFYAWNQGPDMADEDVQEIANVLGIDMIDVVLDYVKSPDEKMDIPAPDLGLMRLEIPLGNHADIDNYIRFHRLSLDSQIF